jgi:predicted nuclease with TOPRIM domain
MFRKYKEERLLEWTFPEITKELNRLRTENGKLKSKKNQLQAQLNKFRQRARTAENFDSVILKAAFEAINEKDFEKYLFLEKIYFDATQKRFVWEWR